jgi:hypothetical protein
MLPAMLPLPRRFRSFSVRTLLVLVGMAAVINLLLAVREAPPSLWERQVVAERLAALKVWEASEHSSVLPAKVWAAEMRRRHESGRVATVPRVRLEAGDVAVQRLWFESVVGPNEIARARRLFPEAEVFEVGGLPR